MKTAYELAMERLATTEPERKLTDKQKKALAEIDSTYRAKVAERETFLGSKIVGAKMVGAAEGSERSGKERRSRLAPRANFYGAGE